MSKQTSKHGKKSVLSKIINAPPNADAAIQELICSWNDLETDIKNLYNMVEKLHLKYVFSCTSQRDRNKLEGEFYRGQAVAMTEIKSLIMDYILRPYGMHRRLCDILPHNFFGHFEMDKYIKSKKMTYYPDNKV